MKVTLIFIILILSITTADAVLIDAFDHKSNLCTDGCHTRFSYYSNNEDQVCGNCHTYGLNVPKLESQHNPNICKRCHPINDKQTFHTVHKEVSCDTKCHTVQDKKVSIPKTTITKCESCHTMKIHVLHQNKVSELCSTCHGGTVSSKTDIISSSTELSFDQTSDYQKFTLYAMFKTLISSLGVEQL